MSNLETLRAAAKQAEKHGIDLTKLPSVVDTSPETLTGYVHAINSNCKDERLKFVFTGLINHLHDFIRETSITSTEWMAAIEFLTDTGKMCSDIRQEFILLSDTLGVSTLVDGMNNVKPPGATEATVLGPFFTEDAHDVALGESIASEGKGEYLFVEGVVRDTKGNPIANAVIDTWETDGDGFYDTQYSGRTEPDCRGRLHSAHDGSYYFRAVKPVSYPIPSDGPVGKMVTKLGRHVYRPAHLHLMVEAPGFEKLTTALYPRNDPYLTSDVVFGVRTSLIVDLEHVTDPALTKARGFKDAGVPHWYLKKDLVLATPEEAGDARRLSMARVAGVNS